MANVLSSVPLITLSAGCANVGLRERVDQLLCAEIVQLGLAPAARDRLLPPYLREVVVEVVIHTLLRLEAQPLCDRTRERLS